MRGGQCGKKQSVDRALHCLFVSGTESSMRHILAVIDTDARYAQSLADYINKTARLPFKAAAYSSINIINSSFTSEVSKENKTFEKWLSNQKIIAPNLKKIFNKAH